MASKILLVIIRAAAAGVWPRPNVGQVGNWPISLITKTKKFQDFILKQCIRIDQKFCIDG